MSNLENLKKNFKSISDKGEELISEIDNAFEVLKTKKISKKADSFEEKIKRDNKSNHLAK